MNAFGVFTSLRRVTERRAKDQAIRARLGLREQRPIPGTGIVRGVLVGAIMWALIIAGVFALLGCAKPERCFLCIGDRDQAIWDSTTPQVRR